MNKPEEQMKLKFVIHSSIADPDETPYYNECEFSFEVKPFAEDQAEEQAEFQQNIKKLLSSWFEKCQIYTEKEWQEHPYFGNRRTNV